MDSNATRTESTHRPHVLVVDDYEDSRDAFALMLELCDCSPSLAATLEMAKSCLRREKYDLVILDVEMIDGNGLEFAVSIRSGQDSFATDSTVPIVIATGHPHIKQRATQIGPQIEGCVKPILLEELASMLSRLLPEHKFEPLSQQAIDAVRRKHGYG